MLHEDLRRSNIRKRALVRGAHKAAFEHIKSLRMTRFMYSLSPQAFSFYKELSATYTHETKNASTSLHFFL